MVARSQCYDKKCMKKILKTGKGSGIYMKTMLWHKICEKSYKNKEKVAEFIKKITMKQNLWKSFKKKTKVADSLRF